MAPKREPYSILAEIYDEVMAHVDYDNWADYVEGLIERFGNPHGLILELGCGTGSLAQRLAERLRRPYVASDNSPAMLAVARKKLESLPSVRIKLVDFRHLPAEVEPATFDIAILAYDGINYATTLKELRRVLEGTAEILNPGGIFLFDQTTPANSINNLPYFGDESEGDGYSYKRSSSYDRKSRMHTTTFVIRMEGHTVKEHHVQCAFTRSEMAEIIHQTGFDLLGSFEAFGFEPADDETERIQWVAQKPDHTA